MLLQIHAWHQTDSTWPSRTRILDGIHLDPIRTRPGSHGTEHTTKRMPRQARSTFNGQTLGQRQDRPCRDLLDPLAHVIAPPISLPPFTPWAAAPPTPPLVVASVDHRAVNSGTTSPYVVMQTKYHRMKWMLQRLLLVSVFFPSVRLRQLQKL